MFRRRQWQPPHALADSDLGAALPSLELRELERQSTRVDVRAGQSLIREGAAGRQCLVVIDGSLAVQRRDDLVATLGPGGVAGEIGLLTRRPCTADVFTTDDTAAYVMNRREFRTVLDRCPNLAHHVVATALERSFAA